MDRKQFSIGFQSALAGQLFFTFMKNLSPSSSSKYLGFQFMHKWNWEFSFGSSFLKKNEFWFCSQNQTLIPVSASY